MIFPGEEPEEIITYKRSKHKAKREAILSALFLQKKYIINYLKQNKSVQIANINLKMTMF